MPFHFDLYVLEVHHHSLSSNCANLGHCQATTMYQKYISKSVMTILMEL